NTFWRYMPSLAVDRAGDMALGYTLSNATTNPSIMYAGRLATDPVNTFSQTEQTLFAGGGSQSGNCGASACLRWGDYSAMALDPDGCTFWYTNGYFAVNGLNDLTRIGSFNFPGCTPVANNGALQGTITDSATGNPLAGVTVSLGSRTALTDASGHYSFSALPSGKYPKLGVASAGYVSQSVSSVPVSDGNMTQRDFVLTRAPLRGCLVDTSQTDFRTDVPTTCDLNSSPGDITLVNPIGI